MEYRGQSRYSLGGMKFRKTMGLKCSQHPGKLIWPSGSGTSGGTNEGRPAFPKGPQRESSLSGKKLGKSAVGTDTLGGGGTPSGRLSLRQARKQEV